MVMPSSTSASSAQETVSSSANVTPIRLRRSSVEFLQGEKAVEKLRFINLSGKPLQLQCEGAFLPECLSFSVDMVEEGKEGEIVISYDPSKPGAREQMKVILKGLGLAPTKATITVNLLSF
mgnify:CR=1 FL=1